MRIDMLDLQDEAKVNKDVLIKYARAALKAMGEEDSELSLLLVNDPYIKGLNVKYRKVNAATNVLAFSIREGEGFSKHSLIMGDVVMSVETAKREAKKRGVSIEQEMILYMMHGILHLLGYDDERPCDRKRMEAKQRELLRLA